MPARLNQYLLFFIIALCLLRLVSLGMYPLMDNTEARYAEIGRLMLASGNWVTPHLDIDTSFWGKPPLSFWFTASSFYLFGENEFAARLPSWILGCLSLLLMLRAAKSLQLNYPLLPLALTISSVLFFVSIGAVMTDASLMFAITLSITAMIVVLNDTTVARFWKWLFFVGLALGLLAKGPIALVFVGAPLFVWFVVHGEIARVWQSFPWGWGLLLMLVISSPWYIWAEIRSPGFLNYFIIGEHIKRFLDPGWQGDLYGSAHQRAFGTIWFYFFLSSLPWSAYFCWKFLSWFKHFRITNLNWDKTDFLLLYLALFPVFFFTFAGNILWTYVLPGVPALMLLVARKWEAIVEITSSSIDWQGSRLKYIAMLIPIAAIIVLVILPLNAEKVNSEKYLLASIPQSSNLPIYYFGTIKSSAQFYSKGRAHQIQPEDFANLVNKEYYLAVQHRVNQSVVLKPLNLTKLNHNQHFDLYHVTP